MHTKSDVKMPWSHMIWSAVGGAIALGIVGFTWGGWVTGGKAAEMVRKERQTVLIEILTPICVANFQKAADSADKLAAFKKMSSSYSRELHVRENKWAVYGKDANSGVIDACAEALYKS